MEALLIFVSLLILGGLIISPILIFYLVRRLKVKYKFIVYLALGIVINALITLTFAWWTTTSNEILLSYYGYRFDAMSEAEKLSNVAEENRQRVESLEISLMGIGWPLKGFIIFTTYGPYVLIGYVVVYLIKGRKKSTMV